MLDKLLDQTVDFLFALVFRLGLGHDVDTPAGQFRSKADVLPATANRLGQIILGHGNIHGMRFLVDQNRRNIRRRHGVDNELGRVVIPQDDIDTLILQLAGYRLYTRTAHADTGTYRIDATVIGLDRDLGPRARISRRTLDLNELFSNLGNLDLEQLHDQFRTGARQNQLCTARLRIHLVQQSPHAVIHAIAFTGNHLATRQKRLGVIPQVNDQAITGRLLDDPGDQFALTLGVLAYHLGALGLTDFLYDHLLGSLCRDTTKGGVLDQLFDHITQLERGFTATGKGLLDFSIRILELVIFHH